MAKKRQPYRRPCDRCRLRPGVRILHARWLCGQFLEDAKPRKPHLTHTVKALVDAGVTQVIMPDVRPPVFKEAHILAVEAWLKSWGRHCTPQHIAYHIRDDEYGLVTHTRRAKR